MKSSGARALWLSAIASMIQDGGNKPPSLDSLCLAIPTMVGSTSINDGHMTAAAAFGEDRRDDCKAGQRFIIEEMLWFLRDQGLVSDKLKWQADRDGTWQIKNDEGVVFTIFGQKERRLSKDRSLVGERDEETGALIGAPGILAIGRAQPFEVDVIGSRGAIHRQGFQVHPLALAIPPMTEREREALRDSIARDGVKIPLVLYEKKSVGRP